MLVANRGEVAVRVLRACREQGLVGVAVHSDPDAGALHVREAERAVAIGGSRVTDSYLDARKLLAAAGEAGAEAVHPGYGLLSENAGFARAVEAAGLVWIGPPADAIEQMGDKLAARRAVLAAGVEPVPGTTEPVRDAAEVAAFGEAHGWPVAIKAAAGGGGRGIRVVHGPEEAADALAAASREAEAAFGSGACYLERFFERPRHVEVQVLADAHGGIVHLGERDCSVQRRHQKLIEETPSPGLPAETRERLFTWAVAVAKACGYVGAGTVELLWDPETGGAWFLEMNTRLQVEHPITEAVTGVDIVAAQLRIAAGEPLDLLQEQVRFSGHAIECRINAEDPARDFLPSPGTIGRLRWPGGPGVRVDAGYESGDTVSPFYDDLLGKVIVWGRDRDEAIRRMLVALDDLEVEGLPTTAPAQALVLAHEDFRAAAHWTTWLSSRGELRSPLEAPPSARPASGEGAAGGGKLPPRPVAGDSPDSAAGAVGPGLAATEAHGAPEGVADFTVAVGGTVYPVRLYGHRRGGVGRAGEAGLEGRVLSPLAGTLSRVEVGVGDRVDEGALLAVVEAMKMETPVRAPFAGTVVEVPSSVGGPVAAGQTIVLLEAG
ncbi:MAG TPA: biotin carboxylase N-terminal domain-containing protein [Actinomycetes bacterium]|nr:biotin carboxylase N-terminal domain-containing protein [Actinomycetes bacterium]